MITRNLKIKEGESRLEIFNSILSIIKTIQLRDIVDILAIALLIFGLFKLIQETRAVQLLKGVIMLLIVYFLSSLFGLVMLSSLLRTFFEAAVVVIAIIFQPEIRKALEQMGRNNTYKKYIKIFTKHHKGDEWKKAVEKSIVDAADTAVLFSRSKTGALLVFERETMLSDIAATGTIIDAETSVALFGNIFFNKAPLHDGASIIRDGKLFAAGCILPLTSNLNVDINLGTRHRAGLGISEQSDAVVLIVSEETGVISLAVNGILLREFTREELIKKLEQFLIYDRGYDDDEPPKKFFQKNPKSSKREKAEK
ncbi:TIGR00159 family protein [Ruminococcus bromii]|nr:TIGR00159 family protein [Ruminococcus bromii]RGF34427.1 TIGR00159 family protein [Ruminococcus sp. AF43-11]RGF39120.1 TIGR00159 family protein [Ruminococcus sp. AF42-10]RGH85025.1 TIGR00159 family protein [Ruminococcus sp. AM28-29LB]MBD9012621.1 TIGR00159 family protein [Ruminococcus bromii]